MLTAMRGRLVLVLLLAACSEDGESLDGAHDGGRADAGRSRDGGPTPDAGTRDGGARDGGAPECGPVDLGGGFLTMGLLACNAMRPGEQRDFDVFVAQCCYTQDRLANGCETWRIDPPTDGVAVDADGRVTLEATVPAGTSFTVVAELGDGSNRAVSAIVDVYTDERNPVGGRFREGARIDCSSGTEYPSNGIGEIRLCGPLFAVTYQPFEIYQDYWGFWDVDPATEAVTFRVESGNNIPGDLDLEGTLHVEGNEVLLEDVWLGATTATVACGHRLVR